MATERDAARREVLLDQLRYLLAEAEMLVPLLEDLPPALLKARPLEERSVLEAFAHLAALDREVYGPWLQRMQQEETPHFESADPDGEPQDTPAEALAEVRSAREELASALEALPPEAWDRMAVFPDEEEGTVYTLALRIARHDADVLRMLTYRMHEAELSVRHHKM